MGSPVKGDISVGATVMPVLVVDRDMTGCLNDPAVLTISSGAADSGPGAAVISVLVEAGLAATSCQDAAYAAPVRTAFTTGTAVSRIFNMQDQGLGTVNSVTLAGQPFNCGNWVEDSGASIVAPNLSMDEELPNVGTIDLPSAGRLNDD